MSASLASRCITILCGVALFIRCLPFGGAHCPNLWCLLSEAVTDLGNDLLSCSDWNESDMHSPLASKLKEPTILDDSIPLGLALPSDVVVPPDPWGRIDACVDDLITVGLLDKA